MNPSMEEISDLVIKKLRHKRVWGKKHKSLDTIQRMGFKSHERGLVKKAVLELIKEGKLQWYDKSRKAIQLV